MLGRRKAEIATTPYSLPQFSPRLTCLSLLTCRCLHDITDKGIACPEGARKLHIIPAMTISLVESKASAGALNVPVVNRTTETFIPATLAYFVIPQCR